MQADQHITQLGSDQINMQHATMLDKIIPFHFLLIPFKVQTLFPIPLPLSILLTIYLAQGKERKGRETDGEVQQPMLRIPEHRPSRTNGRRKMKMKSLGGAFLQKQSLRVCLCNVVEEEESWRSISSLYQEEQ